jgi:NitT/TauT family transport system ATP-binding protein
MSVESLASNARAGTGNKGRIAARHLSVVFGDGANSVEALKDVSLDIDSGEFVSLVGESGCGKTTLLRIIAGLVKPTTGEVQIGDQPVRGPMSEIGFVFQKPVLLDWRKITENVLLPVEIAGLKKSEKRGRAAELLRLLGLERFSNHYPGQLSGGMQQRVSIARTLIMNPSVLLMDEPFGALDAITREQLNLELLEIWQRQRSTCVFVTHDIPESILLSDRVFLMTRRPGRIQEEFRIDLPRPRTLEMRYSNEFTRMARDIKHAMLENIREES